MKFAARFPFVLTAAGLIFSAASRAEDVATTANPYTTLSTRNVFGLVPIPVIDPAATLPPAEPPPKITPNGIMSIFGKVQVLFKTPGKVKAGVPPKEESYVMGEGERQDDIEVKKIDEKAGVVTFDNHGVIQELALVIAANVSAPTAAPGLPGGLAAPRGPGGLGGGRFGRPARPGQNVTSGGAAPPAMPTDPSAVGGGVNPSANNNNVESLSPEAQVLMIEKNRMDTQAAVDNGTMPPLPPTPLTPADAKGYGGSSLIALPEPTGAPAHP